MYVTHRGDDLRAKLIDFSKRAVEILPACTNVESTKLFLIMPMLGVLGYDYTNPFEVHPEHAAELSGANKVDLAILRDGQPVIAVQCKNVGTDLVEEREQLRTYFNALASTKLGVLTNGIVYEFFVDSNEPNVMDEEPFLTLDLEMAARVGIGEEVLDGLRCVTKTAYDPERLAESAYLRLLKKRLRTHVADEFLNPSEDFCRHLLRSADVRNVRRETIERYYAPLVKAAMDDVARIATSRKVPVNGEGVAKTASEVEGVDGRIVTTERELAVYAYVRRRLAFLIKEEAQFAAIEHVQYKDYLGKMRVYLARELKGRLFDYIEGADGYDKFIFPDPIGAIVTNNLVDIDAALRATFLTRFQTLMEELRAAFAQRRSA